jgi:hypothetical protein
MDIRLKQKLVIAGAIFTVAIVVFLVVYALMPRPPATQYSDKTVIIDNYASYTEHISSESFGYLGNYLYEFIKDPEKGVYNATIVDNSYTYSPESWFSKFTVKLLDSDISWKISMQTINSGAITGDIAVTCTIGGNLCLSFSDIRNSKTTLQDLLPINTVDYIIANQKGSTDKLSIIYYDNDNVGKTKAIEKIKSLGFDPSNFTIQYFYGGR